MKNINDRIINCQKCPRLIRYIGEVAEKKRAGYADWEYWGKPVPNFDSKNPELLIVGLAPAAHGANRTGRMFTGDRSGDWLYRALHKAGFANQASATDRRDGLELRKCLITAAAHCAPPQNKPTPQELKNCQAWLLETFKNFEGKAYLALGGIAWKETFKCLKELGEETGKIPPFSHGAFYPLKNKKALFGSYHPSQQNTFTGRLTEPMFDSVFQKINEFLPTPKNEPQVENA